MITWDDLKESSGYQLMEERCTGDLLSRQLERGFGTLPSWAVDKIRVADLETLEGWALRVPDVQSLNLEELLA